MVLVVKNLPANAEDLRDSGSIPRLGRSPGERQSNPLQHSCLENPMGRVTWWATIHRVAKSQTQLSSHTHTHTHTHTELWLPPWSPCYYITCTHTAEKCCVSSLCDYGLELSWGTKWRHLELLCLADKVWGDLLVIDGPCIALTVHNSPEIVIAKMGHEKWPFHSVNSSTPISRDDGHLCAMTHTLQGCSL